MLFTIWNEISIKEMSNLGLSEYWSSIVKTGEDRVKKLRLKSKMSKNAYLISMTCGDFVWPMYNFLAHLRFSIEEISVFYYKQIGRHYKKANRNKIKEMKNLENSEFEIFSIIDHFRE